MSVNREIGEVRKINALKTSGCVLERRPRDGGCSPHEFNTHVKGDGIGVSPSQIYSEITFDDVDQLFQRINEWVN